MKFSFIVLNYKAYDRTLALVRNIKAINGDYNIFVVDNSCDISGYNELKKEIDKLGISEAYTLYSEFNGGYAQGNNLALEYGIENNCLAEYVIILNNDIEIPEQRFLEVLSEKIRKHSDYKAFGLKVVHKETGYTQGPYNRKYIPLIVMESIIPLIGLSRRILGRYFNPKVDKKVFRVMGSAFIIETKLFSKLGFFDPNTFLGGEEDILGEKLRNEKSSFIYLPEIKVIHDHGLSTRILGNNLSDKYFRESLIYYFRKYRNSSYIEILLLSRALRLIDFWKRLY